MKTSKSPGLAKIEANLAIAGEPRCNRYADHENASHDRSVRAEYSSAAKRRF